MADPTVIGRATFIRGRINGSGDVEVAGRVEGEIACTGEALVDTSGLVAGPINARRIVVRGAIKGDLVAEEQIVLEAGARVVGDLRAPRIAIAQGGLVRGHVQTGAASAARPAARTATATARTAAPAPARTVAPAPAREERPRVAPAPIVKPAPAPAPAVVAKPQAKPTNGATNKLPLGTLAGARPGPPPPVVPVLKKGTKAVQKKR